MSEPMIAIIGGGQAGAMAAAALRQQGYRGPLHLFSDEPHLPYERPPLSKAMLLDADPQRQPVLPASWWQDNNVQLHLGVTLRDIDRQAQSLTLADNRVFHWRQLLLATGAAAAAAAARRAGGTLPDPATRRRCCASARGAAARSEVVIVGAGTIGWSWPPALFSAAVASRWWSRHRR